EAGGVLALVADIGREPGRGVRLRKSRRLGVRARAGERRTRVEYEIVLEPVGIDARLEHIVNAAACRKVHVVAADVLAERIEPLLAAASAQVERRQHAIGKITVFLELGSILG